MKHVFLLISFLGLYRESISADPLMNRRIIASESTYKLVKDAAEELRYHLTQSTGKNFLIHTKDSGIAVGVFLVWLHPVKDSSYLKRLDKNNQDVFLLEGDGKTYVRIAAFNKQGLVNGIYTYLDMLGFRWYHPGWEWSYIPKLTDVRLKTNRVVKPDFQSRSFFGTFGTPRNRVIDKDGAIDKEWNRWSVRNRLGGSYSLQGHAWGYFFWRNIQEFVRHPEYTALVSGARSDLKSGATKFCVSNEGLQQLFVKDRVEELNKKLKENTGLPVYTISVEPSDGEGYCECEHCHKRGGVSNQVFFLANLVAKEFQKISSKAFVNLYAYNKHAVPPDIPLEKNVIVQIIPYGYQDYSSPEAMVADWKTKSENLFIYDYYGLPILNLDMPLIGNQRALEYVKRIRYWHEQGIQGINLESSYSIGATGLGLYLFTRLSWDVKTNAALEVEDYYKRSYGAAASAIQEAQKVLETDTNISSREIAWAKAVQILNLGTKTLKLDSLQDLRLSYYKAYLHYLHLVYSMQERQATGDTIEVDEFMRFTYGIFFTKMVHPFPVSEWLKNYGDSPEYVKRSWDTFNPTRKGMKFSEVKQWRKEEMDEAFRKDTSH